MPGAPDPLYIRARCALLDTILSGFPLKALADGLRSTYDPASCGLPAGNAAVLAAWTIAGIGLARRFFQWNP